MEPGATVHLAELAKTGRSGCKKCKLKIEQHALRIGKRFDANGHEMTHWFHAACWPIPKALSSLAEIQGWEELTNEQKQELCARAPNKAPASTSSSVAAPCPSVAAPCLSVAAPAGGSTHAASQSQHAPVFAAAKDRIGGSFKEFVALADRLERIGSSLEKTAIIERHLQRLASPDDYFLTARFLLPAKKDHDHRVYGIKDKSLVPLLATILRCSEVAMNDHLVESSDAGLTAEKFYSSSKICPAAPPDPAITLLEVNSLLDKLAEPSPPSSSLLAAFIPRTEPQELRVLIRLIRKDLRVNAGSAVVLKAIGGVEAYERFKAQPQELKAICLEAVARATASGRAKGRQHAAAASPSASTGSHLIVGKPFKPQLAGQCNSFDVPVAKYPRGFFCEVKYDGERLMAHMLADRRVVFLSRAGKPAYLTVSGQVNGVTLTLTPCPILTRQARRRDQGRWCGGRAAAGVSSATL